MRLLSLTGKILFILSLSSACFGGDDSLFLIRLDSMETGKILVRVPASAGDRFYIDYTHSSDKTPVHDVFQIGPHGEMVLIEEQFFWYGAGLEFMNWEKASVIQKDGKTTVRLRRTFPFLPLRVGRVANHRFTSNGRTILLREIARGGELLKIWVVPGDPP
jgi:hypothetical protein